ncbi:MAG: SUMF1/EgtB/PvdO family nonheme iron enzyme [Planctomycetota bacterium]
MRLKPMPFVFTTCLSRDRLRDCALLLLTVFVLPTVACAQIESSSEQPEAETKGLSSSPIANERFVATSEGYMLPYTETIEELGLELEMVPIPAGKLEFDRRQFSNAEKLLQRKAGEAEVSIDVPAFWMGKYEITWEQYVHYAGLYGAMKKRIRAEDLEDVSIEEPDAVTAPTEIYDPRSRFELLSSKQCPAFSMSQFAAKQFTKWLSIRTGGEYRLPSEAEWTYACLAGEPISQFQPLSDAKLKEQALFGHGDIGPEKVGQREANAWDLHDMLGNVSEYVLDSDGKSLFNRMPNGRFEHWKSVGMAKTRFTTVACGGNFSCDPDYCTPFSRLRIDESYWDSEANIPLSISWLGTPDKQTTIGFRVVRSLEKLPADRREQCWRPDNEDLDFDLEMKLQGGRGVVGRIPVPDEYPRSPIDLLGK